MTQNRFSAETMADAARQSAFLFVPVTTPAAPPMSPLQWMYQKMFEQAVQANQKPNAPDLFAVMN